MKAREIKFRGKHIDNGQWIIGGIYFTYAHAYIVTGDRSSTDRDGKMCSVIEVDPDTVGQFTGQKDERGVEVYEGDIVTTRKEKTIGFVEFYQDAWYINIGNSIRTTIFIVKVQYGNIHEHPELLSKEPYIM